MLFNAIFDPTVIYLMINKCVNFFQVLVILTGLLLWSVMAVCKFLWCWLSTYSCWPSNLMMGVTEMRAFPMIADQRMHCTFAYPVALLHFPNLVIQLISITVFIFWATTFAFQWRTIDVCRIVLLILYYPNSDCYYEQSCFWPVILPWRLWSPWVYQRNAFWHFLVSWCNSVMWFTCASIPHTLAFEAHYAGLYSCFTAL